MNRPLVSDELWHLTEPMLHKHKWREGKRGRPPVEDRAFLAGFLFVVRSGIPWDMVPEEMNCGSGVTCRRRMCYRTGVVPLATTLWSHDALSAIAQSRLLQNCFSELRMATLARYLGFEISVIPEATRTVSWRAQDIGGTQEPTWVHPFKSCDVVGVI